MNREEKLKFKKTTTIYIMEKETTLFHMTMSQFMMRHNALGIKKRTPHISVRKRLI